MMATTHGFAGLLFGVAVSAVAPELAVAAAVGGAVGGIFPDLDLAFAHRKTLHFPVYYTLAAVPAVGLAVVSATPTTVGVAAFLSAAALHAASDALGGGLGLRPWEADDHRGVYVHPLRRWVRPRRWIRYDGAPEDLGLAVVLAVPSLVVFPGTIRTAVVAGLVVSVLYTVFRKPMVEFVPERFR